MTFDNFVQQTGKTKLPYLDDSGALHIHYHAANDESVCLCECEHIEVHGNPCGYQLMTPEQQREMDDLTERATHRETMRFTALDAIHLAEYEAFCKRLEREYQKDIA